MEEVEGGSEERKSARVAANRPRIEAESPSQKHQQHGPDNRQSSRPELQPENRKWFFFHVKTKVERNMAI